MTLENPPTVSRATGKIRWLGIAVLLVVAVYSAAWFYAADRLKNGLTTFLEERKASGLTGECIDADVRGFPFRIGYFCKALRIDDTNLAASASFGELRTAAQVYQLGHIVFELDGPAEIRATPGVSIAADWSLMHSSVISTEDGLERTSLTYDKMAGTVLAPALPGTLAFNAEHGESHIRQNGPDLDAAFTVDQLDLKIDGIANLPRPVNSRVDVKIYDRAGWLLNTPPPEQTLRNIRGEFNSVTIDLGDGMLLDMSGPFSVNAEGLISGEFNVGLKNINAWKDILSASFPDMAGVLDTVANMLTALSSGGNDASVKLNVRDGTAFLAFIPLGELPRL